MNIQTGQQHSSFRRNVIISLTQGEDMIDTNLLNSFGQTVWDSSAFSSKLKGKLKVEAKDPEEHKIIEQYEGDCEKCEVEKLKKPCSICEE